MGFLGALGGAFKGAAKGLTKGGVLGGIASSVSSALADREANSHEGFAGQRLPGKGIPGAMSLTGNTMETGRRSMRRKPTASRSFSGGRR